VRYIVGVLALLIAGCASTVSKQSDIEVLPWVEALNEWALKTGYQLIVPSACAQRDVIRSVDSSNPLEALDRMLEGTGLTYTAINERTVAIRCAR
jgi:hypothetical protein